MTAFHAVTTSPTPTELAARVGALRTGIDTFVGFAPIAVTVSTAFPDAAAIRRSVAFLTDVDLAQVLTDLDAVAAAHRQFTAVVDAGSAGSIDETWQGRAGAAASVAVDTHSRSGTTRVATLIDLAASTATALAGLTTLLPDVLTSLEAVCVPTVAGYPVAVLPAALAAGTARPTAVADDLAARIRLFDAATRIGRDGVRDILAELVGVERAPTGASPTSPSSSGELALAGDR